MKWKEAFRSVFLNQEEGLVDFRVLCYHYNFDIKHVDNYLSHLEIEYTENGSKYYRLFSTEVKYQGRVDNEVKAKILYWKENEIFKFPHTILSHKGTVQWLALALYNIEYLNDSKQMIESMNANILFEWKYSPFIKSIKKVRITGKWCELIGGKTTIEKIKEVYNLYYIRPKQKAPNVSNNDVKVTGKAGVISVTGVNSGENIKVYNAVTNVEVKSVIAHDNVVNITLPKGKVYLIKEGSKGIKVAL